MGSQRLGHDLATKPPTTCSVVSDSATVAHQASLSFTISWSLLKLMSIESVMPSNHLFLCVLFCHLQSFPTSWSFRMSQFFASGGQSIRVSASASVLPKSIQDCVLFSYHLRSFPTSRSFRMSQFFGTLPSLQSSSHNLM